MGSSFLDRTGAKSYLAVLIAFMAASLVGVGPLSFVGIAHAQGDEQASQEEGDAPAESDALESEAAPEASEPPEAQETPEAAAVAPVSESPSSGRMGQLEAKPIKKDRVFGAYRVRLAAVKPKFDDGLRFYEDFYGDEKWYPAIAADWFAWDWYVTMGLSLRTGYYTAGGYAAKQTPGVATEDLESSDLSRDHNSPTTLTLIPTQLLLAMEFTPFQRKWLVLDGWFGLERLYFQEVRNSKEESTTTGAMITAAATDDDDDEGALTNKGFKNSTVFGFAANILLNAVDEASPKSLDVMGLGYVYLSPFMEVVRSMKKEGASFGRSSYGVAFTFESLH